MDNFLILIIIASSLNGVCRVKSEYGQNLGVFWFFSWHNHAVAVSAKCSIGRALTAWQDLDAHCLCRHCSASAALTEPCSGISGVLSKLLFPVHNLCYLSPWKESSVVSYPGILQWYPWKVMDKTLHQLSRGFLCISWGYWYLSPEKSFEIWKCKPPNIS